MNVLVLEDSEERCKHFRRALIGHSLDITEFSKEAIQMLKDKDYDILFLDHDLGGQQMVKSGEDTGYEVAAWLSLNPTRKPPEIYLHSLNSCGRDNMRCVLPDAIDAPFAWLHIKNK
jgi:CheY-like chemotaxis protein